MERNPHQTDAPRKLPRSLWILCWVSFFADISSEMIYPLLPLFLVVVLGATKTQLGLMEGAAVLIVSGLAAWAGWRSDRGRRRVRWMRWGYGLPVIGKAILAAATTWPMALSGRWLDRVGKGLRGAPRDALIADLVHPAQRGRAYGLHRAFDTTGALIGVMIAALLLWWLSGSPKLAMDAATDQGQPDVPAWVYRLVIGIGAMLGLASWLLTWFLRDRAASEGESQRGAEPANEPRAVVPDEVESVAGAEVRSGGWSGFPIRFWIVLGVLALFALANSSDVFLLLRAGESGFSPWAIVAAFAVFNFSYALFSYPAGVWSDRLGRWQVIGVGWLIYVIVYVCMGAISEPYSDWIWVLMGIYGLYMALTEGAGKALIADHAPRNLRGRAMGVYHAMLGVCGLAASLLTGIIWDVWGGSAALFICAVLAFAALLALCAMIKFLENERGHSVK